MKVLVMLQIFILGVLAIPVGAAELPDGWYLGGALGSVNVDSSAARTGAEDASFNLYGGYQFGRGIALEAGYVDFGDLDARPGPLMGIGRTRIKASGFAFAAAGRIPLGRSFDFEAKLGAFFWDGDSSVPGVFTDPGTINPYGALGLGWNATDRIALTASWTYYDLGPLANDVLGFGMRISLAKSKD